MAEKAKYWCGVLYTENMIENWELEIGDIVQVPYAYCVHNDVDEVGELRKEHVHLILVWGGPTTYNNAFKSFDKLSANGKRCVNKIESVIGIRQMYEYLIHNTDSCRKKGKKLYPQEARMTGNCFDIGSFEQISVAEKNQICMDLCELIREKGYTNFIEFYSDMIELYNYDMKYFEILRTYSGLFERLTKGNYQRIYGNQSIRQTQRCFNKKEEKEELPID